MINRVVLVGRLTRDPELRNTNSGNPVCTFTLAVDNRQKAADGSKTTSYITCVVFSQQADNVSKFVRKGSLVGVEGRLQQRSYERKDGGKANVIEVLCDSVQFLEPKSQSQATSDSISFDDEPQVPSNESNLDSIEIVDDDLPF
jgi:single-strand DNA-binding protein